MRTNELLKGKNQKVHCLLCGGEMKLVSLPETSYWQCLNPHHRLSIVEYSDLVGEVVSERMIRLIMMLRAKNLKVQKKEMVK